MRHNRRGEAGNQLMVFSFLFAILLIGVGIVTGVLVFYGSGYDVRTAEAVVLHSHIRTCLFEHGIDGLRHSLYDVCRLNKASMENHHLGFKLCEGSDAEVCVTSTTSLAYLGSNFEACLFSGAQENKNYPRCSYEVLTLQGKEYFLITSSNQQPWRKT